MLRKSRYLHIVLTCLFLSLSYTAVAHADPITFEHDFKPLKAVATVSGGAVVVSSDGVETVTGQNGHWSLLVNVKLVNDAILGDMISVEGTMLHLNNRPDDGQHKNAAQFMFSVTINPQGQLIKPVFLGVDHLPHSDRYNVSADVKWTGNQIDSWKIKITGEHVAVPEPASMLLLGTGLVGVAIKMRKRLKK